MTRSAQPARRKPTPTRSPRPTARLDRHAIVEAAIDRLERHGQSGLSARKLAQDLGCEAMSLYHHVGGMDALKDAMVDELLGQFQPAAPNAPAQRLKQEAEAYLDLALAKPHGFALIVSRRWRGKRAAAYAGRAVASFAELGLAPGEALGRARVLGAYLNGAGLALAAWAHDPERDRAEQVRSDLEEGLDLLLAALTGQAPRT